MLDTLTFTNYRSTLRFALDEGYQVFGCHDYIQAKEAGTLGTHVLVLRHDIDLHLPRAVELAQVEADLGVRATYFVRLHDPTYNILGYEDYVRLKRIQHLGHELALHFEAVDFGAVSGEHPAHVFERDLQILERVLDTTIHGCAPHGDFTGYNNQDLWADHQPSEFGLLYDAYGGAPFGLFQEGTYVSQYHGNQWKTYVRGTRTDDTRNLYQHLEDGADASDSLLYTLIHPRPFFHDHYHVH